MGPLEEALSMDRPPSAAAPRARLFSHKVLASLDQVLPLWASASPLPHPLVPRWELHWEALALQVKYTIPTYSRIQLETFLCSCSYCDKIVFNINIFVSL